MSISGAASALRAFEVLRAAGEHVSFAESLTAGLTAATFVGCPGASGVFNESYVTYSDEAKARILGVRRETLENFGAVSAPCAREMAEGVRRASAADWGVSTTGFAGPASGTEYVPVGTVFVGVSGADGTRVFEFHFSGDRDQVREQACQSALGALAERLTSGR